MSPLFRRDPFAGDHGRARELAAARLDESLPAADDAWLEEHLAGCEACTAVATGYDEERGLLRALRDVEPVPPRDLWARTAAAIEADGGRGDGGARYPRATRSGGLGGALRSLPLAPLAAVMVLVIAVGAGLLNGVTLFPGHESTTKGEAPGATPIALTATEVQVLTRAADGSLELTTKQIDAVCPVGADACGTSAQTDNTPLSTGADLGNVDAVISPSNDHIVLMQQGPDANGVYVVPVRNPATAETIPPATPTPSPVPPSVSPVATPSPSPVETPSTTPTVTPSTSPEAPSDSPDASPSTSPEATPTPSEPASPSPAPATPSPTPAVTVTPAPDGTIEIAHDVIVVGGMSGYSPDGTMFAFSARPADGSAGPDVYVWRTSETAAHPVTRDHRSVFATWAGPDMLVSRVVDGAPLTVQLDPATGEEKQLTDPAIWRPIVGPDRRTAVWWDGTVLPNPDGFTWRPGSGRLVIGTWPQGTAKPQVLEKGKVGDWDARWDDAGTVLAVWIAGDDPDGPGTLSLYAVDADTGAVNLDKPMLPPTPAFRGFSLRPGRLVWTAPAEGGDTTVEVWAWSGDMVGQLQLPTENGVTVVR